MSTQAKDETVSNAVICSATSENSLPQLPVVVGETFLNKPKNSKVIPDTGAGASVAGVIFLKIFGIERSWLNPPQNNLRHVGGGRIASIGSCFLPFRSSSSNEMTVQKVYFIPNITNIFLSLGGCKDLKLVPRNFPFTTVIDQAPDTTEEQVEPLQQSGGQPGIKIQPISSVIDVETTTTEESSSKDAWLPEPEEMPFPATEENISKLEAWLMDTFKDVFDTEQNPLPVMSGKPLHIHISEDAIPHTNFSPIPIPVHWKDAVRKLLERYIKQGIIEKVPAGELVQWIAKMLTVRKKDNAPPLA